MPSREGCGGGTIPPQNFQSPLNLEATTAAAISYFIGLEALFLSHKCLFNDVTCVGGLSNRRLLSATARLLVCLAKFHVSHDEVDSKLMYSHHNVTGVGNKHLTQYKPWQGTQDFSP